MTGALIHAESHVNDVLQIFAWDQVSPRDWAPACRQSPPGFKLGSKLDSNVDSELGGKLGSKLESNSELTCAGQRVRA